VATRRGLTDGWDYIRSLAYAQRQLASNCRRKQVLYEGQVAKREAVARLHIPSKKV
jgi:hypothetical protein